jgi:hypothetical protein
LAFFQTSGFSEAAADQFACVGWIDRLVEQRVEPH